MPGLSAAIVETPPREPRGASLLEASPFLLLERFEARFRWYSDFPSFCQDLAFEETPETSAASDLMLSIHRPNGPGDPSPGLRPKADALGNEGNKTPSWRPERPREPGSRRKLSRPFRPHRFVIPPPRASAFGLSPGLRSPGPLGRTELDEMCITVRGKAPGHGALNISQGSSQNNCCSSCPSPEGSESIKPGGVSPRKRSPSIPPKP